MSIICQYDARCLRITSKLAAPAHARFCSKAKQKQQAVAPGRQRERASESEKAKRQNLKRRKEQKQKQHSPWFLNYIATMHRCVKDPSSDWERKARVPTNFESSSTVLKLLYTAFCRPLLVHLDLS